MKERIEIYTDGSCDPNPGRGGWGFVALAGSETVERNGCHPDTTNNRMEMQAIIEALKWLQKGARATIFSDSDLCVKILSRKWRPKKNLDLVTEAFVLIAERDVRFQWIRAHDGHRWNERADELAARWRLERPAEPDIRILLGERME